ncbi:hypothetical protein [Hymenobacter yonginensis]|uniref:DUF5666 domain-containing protein n=1 Tax=Hymenobacter yonginensis TaxID=748197 RepID=A0ABY7PL16_9BACT|nr:hypothetical protein [Hymenobacter yonginensis]WBO83897.1 hypothetical protein O9Z63_16125 [Hymenobacter yonginensis]
MFFSPKSMSTLALAALLASPAFAQQTTTKTKTKGKASRTAAATPAPPVAGPEGTPPPPPGGPHGKGPHGKGPHGKGGPEATRPLRQVQTLTGTLTRYTTNPEGFYDGFVLPLNGTETTVHFPLHMAKALMAAAKPGQSITFGAVSGHPRPDRPAGTAGTATTATAATTAAAKSAPLELVSVQSGGSTLLVQPPARPATTEAAPATTSVSGRILERRTDDRGQLRGLVLADNTLLLVPPHVGEQLGDKLKVGETVQATGAVLPLRDGMVAATDVRRFHAQTLTVGGVQFLMR